MVFRIVSELPGRLRLRCGARLFTDEEARGVSYALMAADGVRTAEVHAANGSILLTFEPACREAVLAAVRGLDPLRLPAAADPGLGTREGALEISLENNRFQVEVTRLVLWRAAKRVLLIFTQKVVRNTKLSHFKQKRWHFCVHNQWTCTAGLHSIRKVKLAPAVKNNL